MAKMSFEQAKKIRGESLSNRIAGRLVGGESFGTSISKSLSEGTKARMTGLREKINPMNIAKFMTGGSPLAAAMVGRMTGASKEDMRYFTNKQGKMDTASKIKPTVQDEGVLDLLNEIYLLLEDSRKSNLKEFSTEEEIFEREKRAKDRHNDLLKALNYKPTKEQTATKEKQEGGLLNNILSWFKTPLGAFLLGLTGTALFFMAIKYGLEQLLDITPNFGALSPEQAQNILKSGTAAQIAAAGGREYLEDVIKNQRQRALDAVSMPETTEEEKEQKRKAILALGGQSKVDKIIKDEKVYEVPADRGPAAGMADKLPFTKEQFIKMSGPRREALQEAEWGRKYAPYYNDDGTKKTATPQPIAPVSEEKTSENIPGKPEASIPPQENTPSTAKINDVIRENAELNLPTAVTASNEIINNTNINTESQVPRPVTDIPSVRNTEETFRRMILYSTRVV
jgi:hypothetical protein